MAYASKELKFKVLSLVKEVAKKHGVKLSVSAKIENYSTIILNIESCSIDLHANMIETMEQKIAEFDAKGAYMVSDYEAAQYALGRNINARNAKTEAYIHRGGIESSFYGNALELIKDLVTILRCDYYDNSEIQTDYIDVAYYYKMTVGNNKDGFTVK